jgi:hypothetical protein
MSIVQIALKHPYTFIVMAMLTVLATPFALLEVATDIFPENPVIYNGLPATEMGQRISAQNERSRTPTSTSVFLIKELGGGWEQPVRGAGG